MTISTRRLHPVHTPPLQALSLGLLLTQAVTVSAQSTELSTVERQKQLEELVVTAKKSDTVVPTAAPSATKSAVPLLEESRSLSVIARAEIDQRGAQSVEQAVAYTPGVLTGVGGTDSRVDDVMIRGFEAGGFTGNSYLDGLRLPNGGQWTTTQFDTFGLESVEVLKGPASVLFGQVAPGGLINLVSKRPTAETAGLASVQYGSFGTWQYAADSRGAIDQDGQFLYRLSGLYRDGGSQVDHTDLERIFVAPAITWNISENTALTVLSSFQKDRGGSTYQFLPVTGTLYSTPHGKIDRDAFIGEPDFNTFNRDQYAIGYELKHRINDIFSLQQNARYTKVDTVYEGVVAGRTPPNAAGNMSRRAVRGIGTAHNFALDTRLNGEFSTGPIEHSATLGVDYLRSSWNHDRRGTNSVPPINIFDPVYSGITAPLLPQVSQDAMEHQTGIYLQDQIAWGKWRLSVGGRYDETDSDLQNLLTADTTYTNSSEASGHAGLLYLFDSGIAPYFSYATSFEPVSGTTASGVAFDPSEGRQYEIGLKYEPKSLPALFTLSAFELTQSNVLTQDPDAPTFQVQTGEVQIRGIELESKIALHQGLTLIGGASLLDSEITRDNDGNQGNDFASVPDQTASLWLDYEFQSGPLEGLGLGSGVRYVSARRGDNANLYQLPSYTLLDAAIRYDLGNLHESMEGARISLSGSNLADRVYVAKAETVSSANYGAARMIQLNITYTW
jgi:iron complex outermembrane receptor protein